MGFTGLALMAYRVDEMVGSVAGTSARETMCQADNWGRVPPGAAEKLNFDTNRC
jgi:hypothetical protein